MRYLLFVLVLLSTGCGDDWEVTIKQEQKEHIQKLAEALVADKSCNGAGDCDAIAWGVNACGNTKDYLVFAPSQTDVAQLEQLAAEYNQLDREINAMVGGAELIDCELFLIKPELECDEQVCKSNGPKYVIS